MSFMGVKDGLRTNTPTAAVIIKACEYFGVLPGWYWSWYPIRCLDLDDLQYPPCQDYTPRTFKKISRLLCE